MRLAHYLPCILLLFYQVGAIAQTQGQQMIDSLLRELPKAKDDTNKVLLLKAISFKYHTIDPGKGLKYGTDALELARKLKYWSGIAQAHNSVGTNYMTLASYDEAIEHYKISLNINKHDNLQKGQAINYRNLGIVEQQLGNYAEALKYDKKSLKIYEGLHDDEGKAAMMNNIGVIYLSVKQYNEAINFFQQALELSQKINNKKDEAINFANLSICYRYTDKNDKAMQYAQKALKLSEAIGDKYVKALALENIASAVAKTGDYKDALDTYEKALAISGEIKAQQRTARILGGMGRTYLAMARDTSGAVRTHYLNQSLENLQDCVKLCKDIEDTDDLEVFTESIADAYVEAGDYKQALQYYKEYIAVVNLSVKKTVTRFPLR